jgi:hypothetical protein
MGMQSKRGDPAFPIFHDDGISYGGMSIRDFFAGQALIGLVTTMDNLGDDTVEFLMATVAYKIADAMCTERERLVKKEDASNG